MINEITPATAATVRGQEPTGGTMFSNNVDDLVHESNALTRLPSTYEPTPTEIDAADSLAGYDVRVRYNGRPQEPTTTATGDTFRWAGVLEVHPAAEAIVVRLPPLARELDLRLMLNTVRRLQAGHWNALGLTEHRAKTDGRVWHMVTLGYAGAAGLGRYVIPCTTRDCVEHGRHHLSWVIEGERHEAEVTEHREGFYRLKAARGHEGPWELSLDVEDQLDACAAADLANDLQWTRVALEKLNAPANEGMLQAELLAHRTLEHVGGVGRA